MLVAFNWMADTANSTLLDAGYLDANKYSWVLYWDIFKLLLNSLIFSGFVLKLFGQDFPSVSVVKKKKKKKNEKKTHLPMQKMPSLITGSGRSPGGENGILLQYSYWERGA